MNWVIILILAVLFLGGGGYGYHAGWYAGNPYAGPGIGIGGLILLVVLFLAFTGRL